MGLQECLNLPFSLSLYLEEVTGSKLKRISLKTLVQRVIYFYEG
jgi:hypothetical protein